MYSVLQLPNCYDLHSRKLVWIEAIPPDAQALYIAARIGPAGVPLLTKNFASNKNKLGADIRHRSASVADPMSLAQNCELY